MNALALVLGLILGPEGFEEDRLPRSLSETILPPATASAEEETSVWVGLHLGAADAVDARSPGLIAGFEWRIHILTWLGAGGGVDFLSKEEIDSSTGGHFFQVPFTWSVLLYSPLDLGMFRPYGLVGGGFTITNVSGLSSQTVNLNSTDLNVLYYVGLGVEFTLGPNVLLDASVRYVWAHGPPRTPGFDADWRQITLGVLVKLPR
jgi:opacity protein-like surface antigen